MTANPSRTSPQTSAMEAALMGSSQLAGTSLAAEVRAMRSASMRFVDLGTATGNYDITLANYRLAAPPPDATPTIDAAAAARVTWNRGPSRSAPTVLLAVLIAVDRQADRALEGRLVYVVRADDVSWAPGGPPPRPGEPPRARHVTGTKTTIVDAHSSAALRTQLTGTAADVGER